jgi:hypothetical protein
VAITRELYPATFIDLLLMIQARITRGYTPHELATILIAIAEEKQFPIEGVSWWIHIHPPGSVLSDPEWFRRWIEWEEARRKPGSR